MTSSTDVAQESPVPGRPLKVLIVGDCARRRDALCGLLSDRGHTVCTQDSTPAALDLAATENFDVVVVEATAPAEAGAASKPDAALQSCTLVARSLRGVPFIVVANHSNLLTALAAVRTGAFDLLSGSTPPEQLWSAVERAALRPFLGKSAQAVQASASGFSAVTGNSPPVLELIALLSRVSELEAPMLLSGEVGSGKAQLAKAVHQCSKRSQGPFLTLNCAAGHESYLEAELFGHVNAHATGQDRSGLLARASGGTLFLDEISGLPLWLQPKLLTALQEGRYAPIGRDETLPCNVRLIAATRRNLEQEVQHDRFQADLFYWISTLQIPVPALRERGSDVLIYAQEFIERFAQSSGKPLKGLSQQAAEKLLCYDWPGNLRELRSCIERAVSLTEHDCIELDDLPKRIRDHRSSHVRIAESEASALVSLDEIERRHVLRVLEATAGNKTLAAQILGVDRRTLHRKCERYAG